MKRQKFDKTKSSVVPLTDRNRLSPQQLDRPLKMQDGRLDKVVPLIRDILTKLLGSAGMMRYRKEFLEDIKEAMIPLDNIINKDTKVTKKD